MGFWVTGGTVTTGAVVNVILNVLLIPRMGAMGAVIGTLAAEMSVPTVQFLLLRKELPYGLYVKVVNGITAIYEEDGSYWAFYENDQYGLTGVDLTDIDPSVAYSFVQTKD